VVLADRYKSGAFTAKVFTIYGAFVLGYSAAAFTFWYLHRITYAG